MKPLDVFAILMLVLMVGLFAYYRINYRTEEIQQRELHEYIPAAAWLRAGILFCLFYLAAWITGTLEAVLASPIASIEQTANSRWLTWVVVLTAFILFAYWGIWARFTIRFDRRLDLLPQVIYGLVWGTAFGGMLLSIWRISDMVASDWQPWAQWLVGFSLIGLWQWLLMDMYWDVYISPEHDSPKSIRIKTIFTHIPNVTLCLIFLAIYGNYAIFIALQTLALVGCSIFMRMPAPWSREKTPPARRTRSIFFGLPRCGGYLPDDPENDPYLKAAHLS